MLFFAGVVFALGWLTVRDVSLCVGIMFVEPKESTKIYSRDRTKSVEADAGLVDQYEGMP